MTAIKAINCAAALLSLHLFAGCALVYEGKYDWDQGWRAGQVLRMGRGMTLPPVSAGDCRKGVADGVVEQTRYADVTFETEGRWIRHRIVPIPGDLAITEGDRVYINVNSCIGSVVKASKLSRASLGWQ